METPREPVNEIIAVNRFQHNIEFIAAILKAKQKTKRKIRCQQTRELIGSMWAEEDNFGALDRRQHIEVPSVIVREQEWRVKKMKGLNKTNSKWRLYTIIMVMPGRRKNNERDSKEQLFGNKLLIVNPMKHGYKARRTWHSCLQKISKMKDKTEDFSQMRR